MSDKYKQHDGYDKYRNSDDSSSTKNRGRANYNPDGTLSRLDNYSPSSSESGKHHHEWLKENSNGEYEYGHGEHENH